MVDSEPNRHPELASGSGVGLRGHTARLGRRSNDRQRNEAILLDDYSAAMAFVEWTIASRRGQK